MTSASPEILKTEGLTHRFGGIVALNNCSYSLQRGTIGALVGPNGAGKSTLLNLVAGFLTEQEGRIWIDGAEKTGWPAHRVAQRGVIRTWQVARQFERLTVLENVLVAPKRQAGESMWNAVMRPSVGREAERRDLPRALELLNFFDLYELRNDYAATLSGGQRRLLELARAMMADPSLLLLDEPMAAVHPVLIERISGHLQEMRSWGVTLLLIEHNLTVVEALCDSVTVMVQGECVATGSSMSEVSKQSAVVDAYLGR